MGKSETTGKLPSGSVTFVFTDIEGSTQILRELGDVYSEILSLHNSLLREVWIRHRGVEVTTDGDAFLVAFDDATDAIAATVDGQRALAGAAWPAGREVLVRMGMHTGYARPIEGDYRALAVHQAARVVDAANGGQIFATTDVVELLDRDALPEVDTVDLGLYRVRDFDEPVTLYSISTPDLPVDARPPRVRPADTHNLVRPTTSLINRVTELTELAELVGPGALVTLLGPGGAGKTRLSIELGFETVDRWPDGVWFVDIAPLTSGDVVPMAIAGTVSAPSVRGNDAVSDVIAHLAERSMLLVLDNCEHLAEPIAHLVKELRQSCPRLGVLANSRVPLGLLGETLYRLHPLGTDGADSDAVRLFVERTGLADDSDRAELVELCRAVDGLPLAIELAATRAHVMSPAEMTERMGRGVAIVATDDPTLPDRQRSLDRLLDWSLDLLQPEERALLARLSVFADGFDLALAESVGAGPGLSRDMVPELVWSLVGWSLVEREAAAGSTRYSLLATVRSHARQRADADDLADARRRLADALLERLGPGRTMTRRWVSEMDVDIENVRAVVGHEEVPDPIARSLAWSIGQYHDVKASYRSGIAELGRSIAGRSGPGPDLVALLTLQADLHLRLGEVAEAARIMERAVALSREVGVPDWDDMGVVRTQGELALRSSDPGAAARLAETGLSAGPATPRSEARLWNLAAIAYNSLGDVAAACDALDHCLRAEEAAGLDTFLANTHGNYAEALLELGDPVAAAGHQLAALDYARSMGQAINIAFSCMVAGRFALAEGAAAEAVRVQSGADAILTQEGFSLYAGDEAQRTAVLDAAREMLGPDAFDVARAEGRSLPTEQLADQTAAILRRCAASTSTQEEQHVG